MNKKLNSEMSAETAADKSGAADVTTSSHSSANTTVGSSLQSMLNDIDDILMSFEDWMHGEDGGKVTHARGLIIECLKIIPKEKRYCFECNSELSNEELFCSECRRQ